MALSTTSSRRTGSARRTGPARGTSSRALVAALLGGALLLAGCGGGSGTDPEAEGEVGPLGEYFAQMYPEQSEEDMAAQMREVEELTAACMQEQGFDYTPMDTSQAFGDMTVEEDVDYESEEYIATHGYGMTTWEEEAAPEEEEEWVDPNEDYVAGMSESEQTAFYEALYGPMDVVEETDPEAEMAEYDWTTAGCSGEAQHEVDGASVDPFSDPAFSSLQEEMERMYTSVQDDPAVASLDGDWSACMAEAGYDFAAPDDAWQDISDRSDELYAATSESSPEPDLAAMDELQQLEIDTALADHRCQEEVDYDGTYQEVSLRVEQEFVDAHRAELDAMVEAAGQEP
ncbi:hypothetical protein [uncultured Pseudokineococcus sp.]|uniref:hypothetical protein n=1 Tax=uncultured Pseudokineococcus sp. TaxID=1642928 RepID=UPI0026227868|nr:hypothetical protein [uncultured Pseudokineococcus sp.]